MPELAALARDSVFLGVSAPPSRRTRWSRADEAARFGFSGPTSHVFESPCPFTASRYADFLMTESNVIAAVEYGKAAAER